MHARHCVCVCLYFVVVHVVIKIESARLAMSTRTENVNQVFNLILIEFQWNFISDVCASV